MTLIKSVLLVKKAVKTTINDQVEPCGNGHVGVSFFKWVIVCRRNGFWEEVGYMINNREQGLPVGGHDCLEGFIRRCVDYISRQFVPKRDSLDIESVLATALLVELIGVTA